MKNIKRTTAAALALGLMFSPISANAATDDLKSMPLTDVLNLPSAAFDRNSADFDIFEVGSCRSITRAPALGWTAFGKINVSPNL